MKTKSLIDAEADLGLLDRDEEIGSSRALPCSWGGENSQRDSHERGEIMKTRASRIGIDVRHGGIQAHIANGQANGAPSGSKAVSTESARRTVLDELSRETRVSERGSDLIIVLVLADNSCECDGYDRESLEQRRLRRILIDGPGIAPTIVRALRVDAVDAMRAQSGELLASIARALDRPSKQATRREDGAGMPFANLTPRQREIMDLVLAGHPNKIIAADLGISQRTVENHRASIMKKTGAKSLPALVRLAMVAEKTDWADYQH